MKVISVCGRDRTGKSTIVTALANHLLSSGSTVRRVSFAKVLRAEVAELYNVPITSLGGEMIRPPLALISAWERRTGKMLRDDCFKDVVTIQFKDLAISPLHKELIIHLWTVNNIQELRENIDDVEVTIRELLIIHGTLVRRNMDKSYWTTRTKAVISSYSNYDYVLIDDMRFNDELDALLNISADCYLLNNDNRLPATNVAEASIINIQRQRMSDLTEIDVPVPLNQEAISKTLELIRRV